ncbi:hypothetical protein PAL_GLEAN10022351 [Pteropus alecto]|uniref:Uncharacterized protein n=1 Tax=Pteropus alecto TaxID=9402 RepID=L5JVG4_PTEAL|nr:hypothetical protein PAL_GLEAN10022351 [Pteropus alecto]
MTGNSWARAADSKYEHRRRAREDGGARPPRTGPAARPRRRQLPPPPNPPNPPNPPLLQPPEAAGRDPEMEALFQGRAFPVLKPKSRAEHPTYETHLRPLRARKKRNHR